MVGDSKSAAIDPNALQGNLRLNWEHLEEGASATTSGCACYHFVCSATPQCAGCISAIALALSCLLYYAVDHTTDRTGTTGQNGRAKMGMGKVNVRVHRWVLCACSIPP
jgi:hypothetical protein